MKIFNIFLVLFFLINNTYSQDTSYSVIPISKNTFKVVRDVYHQSDTLLPDIGNKEFVKGAISYTYRQSIDTIYSPDTTLNFYWILYAYQHPYDIQKEFGRDTLFHKNFLTSYREINRHKEFFYNPKTKCVIIHDHINLDNKKWNIAWLVVIAWIIGIILSLIIFIKYVPLPKNLEEIGMNLFCVFLGSAFLFGIPLGLSLHYYPILDSTFNHVVINLGPFGRVEMFFYRTLFILLIVLINWLFRFLKQRKKNKQVL